MNLYSELALKLLWGSRLNVSTRLTAIMALGMLTLTGGGAIVVAAANAGFAQRIAQEIQEVERMPDGELEVWVKPNLPTAQANRLHEVQRNLVQDIKNVVGEGSGPAWHYRTTAGWIIPRKSFSKAGPLALKLQAYQAQGSTKGQTISVRSRTERLNERTKQIQTARGLEAAVSELAIDQGSLCLDLQTGPKEGEIWLSNRAPPWMMGEKVVVALANPMPNMFTNTGQPTPLGLGIHKSFVVSHVRSAKEEAPKCLAWLPQSFFALLDRRQINVYERVSWWGEFDLRAFEQKWGKQIHKEAIVENGGVVLSYSVGADLWKDAQVGEMMRLRTVWRTQRLVGWIVMGVMALVSAYQLGTLMMLLGVHYRYEIAIYRSLGMTRSGVMGMFVLASMLLFVIGVGAGTALGFVIVHFFETIKMQFISHMDGLKEVWMAMPLADFWIIMAGGVLLGALSGAMPAWLAANTKPAVVWRSEA